MEAKSLSSSIADKCLAVSSQHTVTSTLFAGMNDRLENDGDSTAKARRVARIAPIALAAQDWLFPVTDGVYAGSIESEDATAVKIRLDMSNAPPGAQIQVMDAEGCVVPTLCVARGGNQDFWTPVVEGSRCILMVSSPTGEMPDIKATGIAHFHANLKDTVKPLECNINIACEEQKAIQKAGTAVGMVIVTRSEDFVVGSGALMNNPDTDTFEPYFLTAAHVAGTTEDALNAEIVWDYRAGSCGGSARSLSKMLRSQVHALLASDANLDLSLLMLQSVPAGSSGRIYLGWSLRTPNVGEEVAALHFPQASHLRITRGIVEETDVPSDETVSGYDHENRIVWTSGVTEQGSSGGPVITRNESPQLLGSISGGAKHLCGAKDGDNYDDCSSFAAFFPVVEQYLTGTPTPDNTGENPPLVLGDPVIISKTGCASGPNDAIPKDDAQEASMLPFGALVICLILCGQRRR
jgi:S1-C subfamily serine protease